MIGTSAGGVEALSRILPVLPPALAVPILIVIHLPRERDSLLPQIFQPKCARPVREAEDKEPIAPGTVYFAPPDYHLLVDAGPQLALSSDPLVNFSRPSIDVLFESAADTFGERLAAVLLTGANQTAPPGSRRSIAPEASPWCRIPPMRRCRSWLNRRLRRTAADFVLTLTQIERLLDNAGRGEECVTKVKCLLVDDLEDNLLVLQALLRRDDVELLLARSGLEALDLLLEHEVALALVDVQMPEMDGFELAELMRGIRTHPAHSADLRDRRRARSASPVQGL